MAAASRDAEERKAPGETTIVVVGHVDHGKSTLLGRLLHDTGQVPADRVDFARKRSEEQGRELEFAFLLDGLAEEQEQGVTIDFTLVRFRAGERSFVFADAPGHREFLRNMVSGASRADGALLVVDASEGVREQTRRHAALLGLLGVSRATVVVNKMDRVGWSEDVFRALDREGRGVLAAAGVETFASVPASASLGENVTSRPGRMAWYEGPTVLEALRSHGPAVSPEDERFRLAAQDVYRAGERRIVVGRVESGSVAAGQEVRLWPSGERSLVRTIESWPGPPPAEAGAGESVALELADPLFVERGMVLSDPSLSLASLRSFDARIVWLGRNPLNVRERYLLRLGHQETGAKVARFHRVVDPGGFAGSGPATSLPPGFIGEATLVLDRPLLAETFRTCPALGRFVLVEGHRIVGGGIVSDLSPSVVEEEETRAVAELPAGATVPGVGKEDRRRRTGHHSFCAWLTGLPGAGKSTIARRVEERLMAAGVLAYVLDGDAVRTGLCGDLGFSRLDRSENVRRVAQAARILVDAGVVAVVALISPYRADRRKARELFGPDEFAEIFVRCPVEICERRDPKGLYRKARSGELPRFTGISDAYEEPEAPELVVDTSALDEEGAAEAVLAFLADRHEPRGIN